MRNRLILPAVVLGASLMVSLPAESQNNEVSLLKIELQSGAPLSSHSFSADLCDMSRQKVGVADLGGDGTFEFRDVPIGQYLLMVKNGSGEVVAQELLTAGPNSWGMAIRLPEDPRQRPPSGPVSVNELQHPPSPKALHAMAKAKQFTQAGDYERAAQALQEAIRLAPDFASAHTNLAAQYARLRRYEDAAAESQRAIALSRPNSVDLCNLAYAQIYLRRFDEALSSARQGMILDPGSPRAHYLVGYLLARDPRTLRQGVDYLQRAVDELPEARPQLEAAQRALSRLADREIPAQ